jgi:hypothetical protein
MERSAFIPYDSSFNHFDKSGVHLVQSTLIKILWRFLTVLFLDLFIGFFLSFVILDGKDSNNTNNNKSRCVRVFDNTPGRWFLLHALWNVGIVLGTLEDFKRTIDNPINACDKNLEYNLAPSYLSMALHLYHCVIPWYCRSLTFQDFMHHIVFAICGLGSMSLAWSWGPGANFAFFFLTGFPGGVDYFMLALVKLKFMDRMTEKKINTNINAWCRGPGCVISAAWTYSNYLQGIMDPPLGIVFLQMILLFVNGQYYATRIALNYQKVKTIEELSPKRTKRK